MGNNGLQQYYDWFKSYTGGYEHAGDDYVRSSVRARRDHTYKVCEAMEVICADMQLDGTTKTLAELCALLHDVGRFEQIRRFHTISDRQSVNHAELSVQFLKDANVLEALTEEDREAVYGAIFYHNALEVPESASGRDRLLMELIRDADKLDIYRVLVERFTSSDPHEKIILDNDYPETGCYQELLLTDLLRNRCTRTPARMSRTDIKLFMLGWLYDINFRATFREIQNAGYLPKVFALLPDRPEMKQAAEHIAQYVEERLRTAK